ncbi:MAG TPA: hypothetical protein VNG29_02130 [Candidatus Paceibacterota bacterium]|nr:hypothetical protein [Candidatus Paceibacterota bacterium]
MKFKEGGRYHERKPELEGFERFKSEIRNWMSIGDDDYCGRCWLGKSNNGISPKEKAAARSTAEFAEKRKGTEGWSAICEECGKEVYVRE